MIEEGYLVWVPPGESDRVYPGNKKKREWVAYKGGKCAKCGYNTCVQSLTFHHVNPDSKRFFITGGGGRANTSSCDKKRSNGRTSEEIYEELDKCVLLCHNCHYEFHAGLWKIAEVAHPNHHMQGLFSLN